MHFHSDYIPARASSRLVAKLLMDEGAAQLEHDSPTEVPTEFDDDETIVVAARKSHGGGRNSRALVTADAAQIKERNTSTAGMQKRKRDAKPAKQPRKKAKSALSKECIQQGRGSQRDHVLAKQNVNQGFHAPHAMADDMTSSVAPTSQLNEMAKGLHGNDGNSSNLTGPPSTPTLDNRDDSAYLHSQNVTQTPTLNHGPRTYETPSENQMEPSSQDPLTVNPQNSQQLPTPPASVEHNFNDIKSSDGTKRQRRPPQRLGNLVGVGEASEDEVFEALEPTNFLGTKGMNQVASSEDISDESLTSQRKTLKTRLKKARSNRVSSGRASKTGSSKKTTATTAKARSSPQLVRSLISKRSTPSSEIVECERRAELHYSNKKSKQMIYALPALPWVQLPANCENWFKRLELSQKLMHRELLPDKPLPQGKPLVWAESRQALCETLSYFKKPQGGCYSNEGHVYGFLFDGLGHCREYVGEDVIICRAGGGMESDGTSMAQGRDQTFKESQVQAILNDIKHQNPVIVICGNRNERATCKMPYVYNVLGWYKPVMAWSEKTAGKGRRTYTTVKYRLERLNRHKQVWHSPVEKVQLSEEERNTAGRLEDQYQTCNGCRKTFPQVYLRHWVCLNANCDHFWKYGDAEIPFGADFMEYNPAFLLHEHAKWTGEDAGDEPEPASLRPPLPDVGKTIGDNLAYINTRGICCPKCGRCNSRRLLKGWVCENSSCDFSLFPQQVPVTPAVLHNPWDHAPTLIRNSAPTLHRGDIPGVSLKVEYKHGYKIATYRFDSLGIKGSFIHATATKAVDQGTGADLMFAALQTEDMGLERRTFAVKKESGGKLTLQTADEDQSEAYSVHAVDATTSAVVRDGAVKTPKAKPEFEAGDLMTAFSMNYGMPYKFVASGASRSFEEAPWPVPVCRRMLNWAQKKLLDNGEEGYEDFNEQLIFAYMQGQKIEYHDDGEEGLGPRIATLSLGCRAKMHMRMKLKHFVGCSKTGLFTADRPVRGGIAGPEMDSKRLEKWEELEKVKSDWKRYKAMRASVPKELGLFEKRMKKADDLVTITLSHGDIVVMDGYDIQKYLEHKVVPEGYFRFALTCRTVLENHLKEHERPTYTVEPDPIEYNGPCLRREEVDGQ